jgi:type IV secretory pathway TrbL component
MLLAADYPFLEVLWTLFVFFAWVAWFWLIVVVAGDIFRRHDIGGAKKALWLIFMLFVPFIGVFSYLIANNDAMAQRTLERSRTQRAEFDEYVRSVSDGGGAAAEIDKAKKLLDSGAISQPEFEAIKQKALAA